MSRGKDLIITHTVVFLLGVTCAKLYDRDELSGYRSAYEKPTIKFRRHAGNLAMGTVALGSLWLMFKLTTRGQRSIKSTCCE